MKSVPDKDSLLNSVKKALFQISLTDWYRVNRRDLPWRKSSDPYYIWLSEAMLQQTQVVTVIPYFNNFIQKFPDIFTLARADLQQVLKAWEKLGYYARARNLHKAARMVVEKYNGHIPGNPAEFQNLPGVGPYIAAAVLSIAFNKPLAVLDGNVKRVLARLLLLDLPVNQTSVQKGFAEKADHLLDKNNPGQYNQAIMELGAVICRPKNPACPECPVKAFCLAFRQNRQAEFPKRTAKAKTPEYHIAAGVVQRDGKLLITRRADAGLLGGLWEFPGGKVKEGETAAEACRREILEETGISVHVKSKLIRIRHAYTHFRIMMDVFVCSFHSGKVRLAGPVDYRWIKPEELDDYPFPGANHKFIPLLRNEQEFSSSKNAGDRL
ncbi:MAG: A/G-specific adenine glycosylase [Calditrichia bacterium]